MSSAATSPSGSESESEIESGTTPPQEAVTITFCFETDIPTIQAESSKNNRTTPTVETQAVSVTTVEQVTA